MSGSESGSITQFTGPYWFLSNFAKVPIVSCGITYPSSEHAFQAAKTPDCREQERIAGLAEPWQAKKAGRQLVLRPDWERVKKVVMLRIVLAKFTQNPDLAAQLAATGGVPLIEKNHWCDNFWGSCTCRKCGDCGLNYLGIILMAVRDVVRPD